MRHASALRLRRPALSGRWRSRPAAAVVALVVLLGVPVGSLALAGRSPEAGGTAASAATDPVVAVGGDIACDIGSTPTATECQQGATANLLTAMHPDAVLPLGDTQYDTASAAAYSQMYDPSWGQVKSISHPVVGNHEYSSAGAAPYFNYFGSAAGSQSSGYYSWNLGAWHLIALNSECNSAPNAGCAAGSTQEQWLRSDLAANAGKCILAYWHEPRFSSGNGGSNSIFQPFWQDLYDAHADVILNGHTHAYERFAPQSPTGTGDAAGPREFVVGTGGVNLYGFSAALPNEQVRQNSTFGVMKMVLHPTSYDWQFVPTAGSSFTDSGTTDCHAAAPAAPAAPTGLAAGAVTSSQVPLSWTASAGSGVAGYRVYRGSSTTPLNGALVTATSFTDTTVAAGTAYSYAVTAVDSAGNESARSASVSVSTPAAGGVVNGGFENNSLTGWTGTGTTGVVASGHSGGYAAQLGSTSPTGESAIAQTFTAPAGVTGLSFWWWSTCPDHVAYDWATATLVDNTTGTTATPLPRTCTPS
ncbi:MAG TPA: metallophosphoesterase, partial [Blastococcus sp.]|nr:metallophosphoesterase [Blastococcus sp.]